MCSLSFACYFSLLTGKILSVFLLSPSFLRQKFPWAELPDKIIRQKLHEPRWDNIWRWLISWLQLIVCGTWEVSGIFMGNPFTCNPSKEFVFSKDKLPLGCQKYFWGNLAPAFVFLFSDENNPSFVTEVQFIAMKPYPARMFVLQ